ncbi:hypothetical protein Q3G72_005581 [Acer saccharum]|nr:hypothetical protein Q3G72_005581 [Acer saccharum]
MLKGKPFRKPDISATIQEILEGMKNKNGLVVDVGSNVGMATFAAAVMGFRVLCFEPVFENLQRICDGVWFNRVGDLVTVFEAAVSDRIGNITFHKLVGRLDNSAVSATGAKLAFKSNEEIALQVRSIPLDEVIPDSEPVLLLKIDVQGWEYHVLKGASKLLSRKKVWVIIIALSMVQMLIAPKINNGIRFFHGVCNSSEGEHRIVQAANCDCIMLFPQKSREESKRRSHFTVLQLLGTWKLTMHGDW